MMSSADRKMLINGCDRGSWRLKSGVKRLGQGYEPFTKANRHANRRRTPVQLESLGRCPAEKGRIVSQKIRGGDGAATGGVDEIEPERIAQQSELGVHCVLDLSHFDG